MPSNTVRRRLGSKRQRSPGRWELRYSVGRDEAGKWVQKSVAFNGTEREAERELGRLVAQPRKVSSRMTYGVVLDRWLAQAQFASTTRREYERLVEKRVKPKWGKADLSTLTAVELARWYETLQADLAPSSVRQVHAVVRSALGYAVRQGWTEANVASSVRGLPTSKSEITVPTPEQVEKLLVAAYSHYAELGAFLTLAAKTGARRGELCGIRWSDIDGADLRIERTVREGSPLEVGPPKTRSSIRRIRLGPKLLQALEDHKQASAGRTGSYVFTDDGENPWSPNSVTAAFGVVSKGTGVKRLHDLRHFAATQMLAAGIDVRTVAGRLGHASPALTLTVYAGWVKAKDEEAAAVLDDLF